MPARAINPEQKPWRSWYSLQRWRRRAKFQLQCEPLCVECQRHGQITPATIADHVVPHRGVWNDFRLGKLQSLCASCHAHRQGDGAWHGGSYSGSIGDDGFPIDSAHPFNKAR